MAVDKKTADHGMRLVLQMGIGHAVVTGEFDANALRQVLDAAICGS
jgi:3-dehydroquinate synthase